MTKKIEIGNQFVGEGESVFIIAEAGSNHNQKKEQAKALIDVAAQSGVDAVKFQLFKAESLYTPKDPAFSIVKENELPREWVEELCAYAKSKGLIFLATPFDEEAVDILDRLDVPALKIASSETVNLSLLKYAASRKRPMLVSTGMCNLADIEEAIEVIHQEGNQDIVLLQCTALYPTDPQDVHLRVLDTFRNAFGLPVGYSDHTLGILLSPVAVSLGACVIEKHFTLDRSMKGPDHSYAIQPDELAQMVQNIRIVEKSCGLPFKSMLPEEKKLARRESLFANKDMPKNTIVTKEMIAVRRPASGIAPRFLSAVIGKKS